MPHTAKKLEDGRRRDIYSLLMSVGLPEYKATGSCYVECQVRNKPPQTIPNSRKSASDLGLEMD